MRRSDHPSRPSAMTCCFFSSLKTLLTLTEGNPHAMLNVLGSTPLAGFQVILIGRFWVIPEARAWSRVPRAPLRSWAYVGRRKRGGVVYDPFLGSGTTLIAAEMTGRICYGIEIDPK